jgi:hypothetical protein
MSFRYSSRPRSSAAAPANPIARAGRRPAAARPGRPLAVEALETRRLLTAAVVFADPQEFATGANPLSVVTADLNGDGRPDLASANNSGSVSVLLGNGDGTFQAQRTTAVGTHPYQLASADFDGDGNADLAVTDIVAAGVTVLLGNGDGTFRAPRVVATGFVPATIAVADFNGDGGADLAVTGFDATTRAHIVGVALGNGDGTFLAQRNTAVPPDQGPQALAVADFNADGRADLVVGGYGASVLLGNGDGTFVAGQRYGNTSSISMAVGDFDADGRADIVLGHFDNSGSSDQIVAAVLLGNGDGTFQLERNLFGFSQYTESVAVGDFNGDGSDDIALGAYGVAVYAGHGDGTFDTYPKEFGRVTDMRSIAAADLNGDGALDIAFVDQVNSRLGTLLNVPPAQQAANLAADVQDLVTAGTLTQARANSLVMLLTNVEATGGSGRLTAFISIVESLLKSRKLGEADAGLLIGLADTLLDSLS